MGIDIKTLFSPNRKLSPARRIVNFVHFHANEIRTPTPLNPKDAAGFLDQIIEYPLLAIALQTGCTHCFYPFMMVVVGSGSGRGIEPDPRKLSPRGRAGAREGALLLEIEVLREFLVENVLLTHELLGFLRRADRRYSTDLARALEPAAVLG